MQFMINKMYTKLFICKNVALEGNVEELQGMGLGVSQGGRLEHLLYKTYCIQNL